MVCSRFLIAVAMIAASWCAAAQSNPIPRIAPISSDVLGEVHRLHYAGQTNSALLKADAYLAGKPNDAQMRFLKGVMLADIDRGTEAIGIFQKLVDDYPDLAEPYNNLAAMYAATGDYGRARLTLEQAVRANPSYATAHENLGDVYAALASQSYARAKQLDTTNPSIEPKLALVRELFKRKPETPRAASAGASAAN